MLKEDVKEKGKGKEVQRKRKENVEKGTQKNALDVDVGREEDEYILFNI